MNEWLKYMEAFSDFLWSAEIKLPQFASDSLGLIRFLLGDTAYLLLMAAICFGILIFAFNIIYRIYTIVNPFK